MARPRGSKNRKNLFSKEVDAEAAKQLEAAVKAGKPWAIQLYYSMTHPKLKAVCPDGSAEQKLINAKIFETVELMQRIEDLEKKQRDGKQQTI